MTRESELQGYLEAARDNLQKYLDSLNDVGAFCGSCKNRVYQAFGEHLRAQQARAMTEKLTKWQRDPLNTCRKST